jgi:hypothetical protein
MRRTAWVIVLLIWGLAACGTISESYRLEAGQTLEGDYHLVVGQATLEEGSTVAGPLNITATDGVSINGQIQGDLTILAKDLHLGQQARIEGDLIYCLLDEGRYQVAEGAIILGQVEDNCGDANRQLGIGPTNRWWWGILSLLGLMTALLLAALANIFLPHSLNHIAMLTQVHKLQSLALGCLTLAIAVGLSSLWGWSLRAIVPVLLAPLFIFLWVSLLFLGGLGLLALAQVVGGRITHGLGRATHPPFLANLIGVIILSLLVGGLQWIESLQPIGDLLLIVLLAWGLGAALMSRAVRHSTPR